MTSSSVELTPEQHAWLTDHSQVSRYPISVGEWIRQQDWTLLDPRNNFPSWLIRALDKTLTDSEKQMKGAMAAAAFQRVAADMLHRPAQAPSVPSAPCPMCRGTMVREGEKYLHPNVLFMGCRGWWWATELEDHASSLGVDSAPSYLAEDIVNEHSLSSLLESVLSHHNLQSEHSARLLMRQAAGLGALCARDGGPKLFAFYLRNPETGDYDTSRVLTAEEVVEFAGPVDRAAVLSLRMDQRYEPSHAYAPPAWKARRINRGRAYEMEREARMALEKRVVSLGEWAKSQEEELRQMKEAAKPTGVAKAPPPAEGPSMAFPYRAITGSPTREVEPLFPRADQIQALRSDGQMAWVNPEPRNESSIGQAPVTVEDVRSDLEALTQALEEVPPDGTCALCRVDTGSEPAAWSAPLERLRARLRAAVCVSAGANDLLREALTSLGRWVSLPPGSMSYANVQLNVLLPLVQKVERHAAAERDMAIQRADAIAARTDQLLGHVEVVMQHATHLCVTCDPSRLFVLEALKESGRG